MNYKEIWNSCAASICQIVSLNEKQELISLGTGFVVNGHILTNNHVLGVPHTHGYQILFPAVEGVSEGYNALFSAEFIRDRIKDALPENSWDFAVIDLVDVGFKQIPSLKLSREINFNIGTEVAALGYQFDQENLSIKSGILSSSYTKADVRYLQIDVNINQGNSGGPLISLESGEVIGIITRKHTGLSSLIDFLEKGYLNQIEESNYKLKSKIDYMTRNFHVILKRNSERMITFINELKRSANVGIGYAYQLDEINKFFNP
jgi:V8-like Glu-specific endopeptidase